MVLAAIGVWIVVEALARFRDLPPIRPGLMLAVAVVGAAANLVAAVMLHRAREESLNTRAAYLHVLGDAAGALGTVLAAAMNLATGWRPADSLISLVIAALILVSAARVARESVEVLLEATPRQVPLAALRGALGAVPGVADVHDLHVWTVSTGIVAMSAHATVPDPGRQQGALEELCRRARGFGIQHVTVQLEQATEWHE